MEIAVYRVTPDRLLTPVDPAGMSDEWFTDDVVRWIKITSAAPQEIEQALHPLELHRRITDACVMPNTDPDVVVFEKALFIRMPVWHPDEARKPCVRFVCVATTLITIQEEPSEPIDELAEHLQGDRQMLQGTTAALLLHLAETLVTELMPVYLALRNDVETTAQRLEDTPAEVSSDDLLGLKRRTSRLEHLLEDAFFCLTNVQAGQSETLQLSAIRNRFQEGIADIQRGQGLIARLEERIRDLRQHYVNYLQEATNRRLNILAVLSAIYLPSTLIAGIYGMNFDEIPITKVPYGYAVVLSVMIGLVVGQLWYFQRRGWMK